MIIVIIPVHLLYYVLVSVFKEYSKEFRQINTLIAEVTLSNCFLSLF